MYSLGACHDHTVTFLYCVSDGRRQGPRASIGGCALVQRQGVSGDGTPSCCCSSNPRAAWPWHPTHRLPPPIAYPTNRLPLSLNLDCPVNSAVPTLFRTTCVGDGTWVGDGLLHSVLLSTPSDVTAAAQRRGSHVCTLRCSPCRLPWAPVAFANVCLPWAPVAFANVVYRGRLWPSLMPILASSCP